MTHLILDNGLVAQFELQARAAFPRECCGLMEGIRRADTIDVSALRATRNVATEADRFEIDPVEHIRLLRAARVAGRQIVGCYHSHPNGQPDLSARDREHADEEGFVWLIASFFASDGPILLRAFVVLSEKLVPLTIGSILPTGSSVGRDVSQ